MDHGIHENYTPTINSDFTVFVFSIPNLQEVRCRQLKVVCRWSYIPVELVVHYLLVGLGVGIQVDPVEVGILVDPMEVGKMATPEEVGTLNYTEVVVLYNHTGSLFV